MKIPPLPPNEAERLRALHQYRILDTLPEQVYDDLTRMAAQICDAPIALVSLIDAERQWFKSRLGLDGNETDRAISFCAHAVATGEMLMVHDALRDERFFDNPNVLEDPYVRFYAGAPLRTEAGHALGTLCVVDRRPRELSDSQIAMLQTLSRMVMSQFDLRLLLSEREQVERARSEMVSIVSHELRTPLTSIRGSLGLIEGGAAGEVPPAIAPLVQVARNSTDRLIRLVNDVLDLERIEAGRMLLPLADLDTAEILGSAISGIDGMATDAGIHLSFEVDPAAGRVRGDHDRMVQVLTNLLSNAIKVSPSGSRVEVRAEPAQNNRVRVSVRDEGPGISEEDVPRLFGRFQQVGKQKGGSGLGLAICRGIVEEHGGRIGVDTRFGEGSTFWFEVHAPVLE
ncbi:MAG TPA: ATP-binding protein [Thermoanaerobaculia bacterium]|nr:ATP-binding protein [Thermoanaerobaculia bacterium]